MPERLTESLVRRGKIDAARAKEALRRQVLHGGALDTALFELQLVAEGDVLDAFALAYAPLAIMTPSQLEGQPDERALRAFPEQWARKHFLAPLALSPDSGTLSVLSPAPADVNVIARLSELLDVGLRPVLAPEFRVHQRLQQLYGHTPPERFRTLIEKVSEQARANPIPPPSSSASRVPLPAPRTSSQAPIAVSVRSAPPAPAPAASERSLAIDKPLNFGDAVARLREADDRDEIIQIALMYAAKDLEFVAMLINQGESLEGRLGVGVNGDRVAGLIVPLSGDSAFKVVVETHAHYLGPLPTDQVHLDFLARVNRQAPRAVLIAPVRIRNRTVALLYGENGPNAVPPRIAADLMLFITHVQLSLEALLRRRKTSNITKLPGRPFPGGGGHPPPPAHTPAPAPIATIVAPPLSIPSVITAVSAPPIHVAAMEDLVIEDEPVELPIPIEAEAPPVPHELRAVEPEPANPAHNIPVHAAEAPVVWDRTPIEAVPAAGPPPPSETPSPRQPLPRGPSIPGLRPRPPSAPPVVSASSLPGETAPNIPGLRASSSIAQAAAPAIAPSEPSAFAEVTNFGEALFDEATPFLGHRSQVADLVQSATAPTSEERVQDEVQVAEEVSIADDDEPVADDAAPADDDDEPATPLEMDAFVDVEADEPLPVHTSPTRSKEADDDEDAWDSVEVEEGADPTRPMSSSELGAALAGPAAPQLDTLQDGATSVFSLGSGSVFESGGFERELEREAPAQAVVDELDELAALTHTHTPAPEAALALVDDDDIPSSPPAMPPTPATPLRAVVDPPKLPLYQLDAPAPIELELEPDLPPAPDSTESSEPPPVPELDESEPPTTPTPLPERPGRPFTRIVTKQIVVAQPPPLAVSSERDAPLSEEDSEWETGPLPHVLEPPNVTHEQASQMRASLAEDSTVPDLSAEAWIRASSEITKPRPVPAEVTRRASLPTPPDDPVPLTRLSSTRVTPASPLEQPEEESAEPVPLTNRSASQVIEAEAALEPNISQDLHIDALGRVVSIMSNAPLAPVGEALRRQVDQLMDRDPAKREGAVTSLSQLTRDILPLVMDHFPGVISVDPFGPNATLPPFGRISGVLQLLERFGRDSHLHVMRRLDNPDPVQRFFATYFYSAVLVHESIPRLIQRLHDEEARICMLAARTLFSYREHPDFSLVLDHLHGRLDATSSAARRHAAYLIGLFRDVTAIPRLIDVFDRKDRALTDVAEDALAEITKQRLGPSGRKWRMWWQRNSQRSRIAWLIDGLSAKEPELRRSAAEELRAVTGVDLGYDDDMPRRAREDARLRWVRWWQEQEQPSQAPSP